MSTPITATPVDTKFPKAAQSNFVVENYVTEKGEVISQKTVTFMHLMIYIGLETLRQSRSAFQTQFDRAQDKVNILKELNEITQLINTMKSYLPSGDKQKSDDKTKEDGSASCAKLYNAITKFNKRYPSSQIGCEDSYFNKDKDLITDPETGDVKVVIIDTYFNMYRKGVEALSSNAQTVSSTLSSENEQQSMRTNQAMNRSSGFLQQLQTMMQAAKDSLQAAAKSGTM
jgi:hypothetical protein